MIAGVMSSGETHACVPSPRSRALLLAVGVAGMLHHVDHALRVDHSGWPFLPEVTPYTYSLLIYPLLLLIWRGSISLWVKAVVSAAIALGVLAAHVVIETPRMQYAMWAYNRSIEPAFAGVQNALCIESPLLGSLSVGVAMGANVLLITLSLSLAWDALKARPALP